MEKKNQQMLQYMPDLLVLRNEHANLVDHLAYMDASYSLYAEEAQALVDKQMEEMAKAGVKDYLQEFPVPATEKLDSHAIRSEIARVT